jgi:hypothetical protein
VDAAQPSPLSGTRNIVEVVFSFARRTTGFAEKSFVRVDVTEGFPGVATRLSPCDDRQTRNMENTNDDARIYRRSLGLRDSESISGRPAGMGFEQPDSVGRLVHMHGPWMHFFVPVTTAASSSGLSPRVCRWPEHPAMLRLHWRDLGWSAPPVLLSTAGGAVEQTPGWNRTA